MMTKKIRNLHISREIRPTPPILLAGGGGWHHEFVLDVRAFLAFRQLPGLAEGPLNHRWWIVSTYYYRFLDDARLGPRLHPDHP